MIEKIKQEELVVLETLHHPKACAEILFNDFNNLGSFSIDTHGEVRNYQIPFQSYDSMFYEDKEKSKKENFTIRKGLGDCYALGGRLTGKSLINLIIDALCAIVAKSFNWAVISSSDLNHVRGIMEKIVIALRNHPVLKLFKPSIVRSPAYSIHLANGCLLESVNNNLASKNPGGNWFGKHIDKNWEEEASFLTDVITSKKLMAESELGCIQRYSGMTTFSKNSPMGRAFYDLQNRNKIINLPSYANPYYDKKRDDDAIQEFGGKNSQGYQVQIRGKIVEHGDSVFDMDRIRETYRMDRKGNPITVKHFEITKDNFFNYKDIIVLDRPKNAEKAIVALDKGEGAAPTEVIILFVIKGIYQYIYNVTNFKLKPDEDEEVINYIIEKLQANVIAIDVTSGTGKTLFTGLSKKYPENVIGVAFNEKIDVNFERDKTIGKIKYDNKGKAIYKKEYIVDWSIQQLKDIFYNKKIKCLEDFKLDTQFNGVVVMKSGIRTVYGYKTANHLFQAFQVFAIAHWMTEFKIINPISRRKPGLGAY